MRAANQEAMDLKQLDQLGTALATLFTHGLIPAPLKSVSTTLTTRTHTHSHSNTQLHPTVSRNQTRGAEGGTGRCRQHLSPGGL